VKTNNVTQIQYLSTGRDIHQWRTQIVSGRSLTEPWKFADCCRLYMWICQTQWDLESIFFIKT